MIKHIWTVLCRESLIDNETNNISLFNVFERLEASVSSSIKAEVPISMPITYELVSLWTKTTSGKEEAGIKILIISPRGNVLKEISKKLIIPVNVKRIRTRMKISGLTIIESGDYLFRIALRGKNKKKYNTVAELPLQVEIRREVKKDSN